MKVKRCPICLEELINADAPCPQCGKVHYSTARGISIYDRVQEKYICKDIGTSQIIYVTDFFFAQDKGSSNAFTIGGGAAGGAIGAMIGGLADEAIRAVKSSTKKASTAVCYYWKDVVSLTYPAEPIQTSFLGRQVSQKVGGRGIDMKLKDGTWLTIEVTGFGKESAKDLYQVMNMLHQNSVQAPMDRIAQDYARTIMHNQNSSAQPSPSQRETVIPHTSPADTSGAKQVKPIPLAGIVSGSGTSGFFKCAHCGVTQMREGNFCAYCGKPAPASEPPRPKEASDGGMATCPKCGNRQEAGSKFCFRCGQKLAAEPPVERNCPHCGAKVKAGMLFCMECGTRLT